MGIILFIGPLVAMTMAYWDKAPFLISFICKKKTIMSQCQVPSDTIPSRCSKASFSLQSPHSEWINNTLILVGFQLLHTKLKPKPVADPRVGGQVRGSSTPPLPPICYSYISLPSLLCAQVYTNSGPLNDCQPPKIIYASAHESIPLFYGSANSK